GNLCPLGHRLAAAPLADPALCVFSCFRCNCACAVASSAILPVPRRGAAAFYLGDRPYHLVCGKRASHTRGPAIHRLLRLLLCRTHLLVRGFGQGSSVLLHFNDMGSDCRFVQRCPTPNRE